MGDALIISGWWVFNESRSGVGSVVVLTLFKRLAHACLGFVPTGYIINEPSRQVARTLAQLSQKSAFEPEKRGTVAFVRKGSGVGRHCGAAVVCHCNYLEDLAPSADDSTGHMLKVTEERIHSQIRIQSFTLTLI